MKIAIIGRPNVGKSALFNSICKKKIAIVDEKEGVTKDRLHAKAHFFDISFDIIDTGGISFSKDFLQEEIRKQAENAIEIADAIIFVVDAKVGVMQLDIEVAKLLLKIKKPVILAVNKIDDPSQIDLIFPFYSLGMENIIGVSAIQNYQVSSLIENILQSFPDLKMEEKEKQSTKIAIIGRPNIGKSTLFNALLKTSRSIVSPVAGTTQDAIDEEIIVNNNHYIFIDTAGIRRKHKEREVIEKFASIRTLKAIERADICLLLFSALEGLTTEEKKILKNAREKEKGCIIFLNKWDLVDNFRMETTLRSFKEENPGIQNFPVIIGSAKTNRNIEKIFPMIEEVKNSLRMQISTGRLNQFIKKCLEKFSPPYIQGKKLHIYYATQIGTKPPKFVFFVNIPRLMSKSYKKYLENSFRKTYGFIGCPIEFKIRGKPSKTTV